MTGTTFVRYPSIEPAFLGDFALPTGSRFLLSSAISDTGAAVDAFMFRPGRAVLLLTVAVEPVDGRPAAQVIRVIDVAIAPSEIVTAECSVDGVRSRGVVGVIDIAVELKAGPNALPARAAWKFDPSAGTIDEVDRSVITCEFVDPA